MNYNDLWNLKISMDLFNPGNLSRRTLPGSWPTKTWGSKLQGKFISKEARDLEIEFVAGIEIPKWQEPDPQFKGYYFPPPSRPQPLPMMRNFETGLYPIPPGVFPKLVPGVGLIPHLVRGMDWATSGTEYHYTARPESPGSIPLA